jgi:hypothetical protein
MTAMKARIDSLRIKIQDSLAYTLDRLFEESQDTYFSYEEKLEELDRLLTCLLDEVSRTYDKAGTRRLSERIMFLEDRFDEIDSGLRGRPRRTRRRFSFYDFFRFSQGGGQWDGAAPASEISSSAEAYQILGIETGSNLSAITAAFRRSVKALHPDARGGDRSAEPELRKLIAAYQYIKKELTERTGGAG